MPDPATFTKEVGFPIFAFCAMFYMCNNTIKSNTEAINRLDDSIKELIARGKESTNDAA